MKKLKEINFSEIAKLAKELSFPKVEKISNYLYRLPGGVVTGIGGLERFEEELQKTIKDYGKLG